MIKGKPTGIIISGRTAFAIAVAQMLAEQRWMDGPGHEERDPDRELEERHERARMENEMDRIWEGDA